MTISTGDGAGQNQWGKGKNMEEMREFVAYCRKLLRILEKLEKALEENEIEKAKELVKELKEDTQKDIEA